MKKSLNWTWVGVAAALIIYLIMSLMRNSDFTYRLSSIIGPVLQTWAIIFFACFGLNKCLKLPFKQRTLWISLACAVGYYIVIELLTLLMQAITNYVLTSRSLLPIVIESILFCVISMALFVLAYMLTRLSREGKSAFALKWNKWLLLAIIITVFFAAYRALLDTFLAADVMGLINNESFIFVLAFLFGNDTISSVLTIICRGAVLFFVSAAALKGIGHSPTKDVQEVK